MGEKNRPSEVKVFYCSECGVPFYTYNSTKRTCTPHCKAKRDARFTARNYWLHRGNLEMADKFNHDAPPVTDIPPLIPVKEDGTPRIAIEQKKKKKQEPEVLDIVDCAAIDKALNLSYGQAEALGVHSLATLHELGIPKHKFRKQRRTYLDPWS